MSRHHRKSVSKSRAFALLAVVLVIAAALVSAVIAKYVSSNQKAAMIHASGFHFSSDHLETDSHNVPVSDWSTRGIVIELYNYEKENAAQISDSEIRYQITVPTGWQIDTVKNNDGTAVFPDQGVYTMPESDARITHTVTVKYVGVGDPTSADIRVDTVSPYEKTIQAAFLMQTKGEPAFSVTDHGGAVCLTIETNSYSGPIRVTWPGDEVSPDNANSGVDMSAWSNANADSGETFQGEAHHTYELVFVKNTDSTISGSFSVERGN